jgi:uncharacterized protein (TIGR02246 family)
MRLSLSVLGLLILAAVTAQAQTVPATRVAPSSAGQERASDATVIRDNDEAFVKAFNAGNAQALAETYTDDAEVTDEEGSVTRGKQAIAAGYTHYFHANPGARLVLHSNSPRFLGPDVAEVKGKAEITTVEHGAAESSLYTVVFVRRGGRWLQASVRDEEDRAVTHSERLRELAWLVGDWVSESAEAVVQTSCRWDENKVFLVRSFTVRVSGHPALTGLERIGWDPLTRQFKSWVFDSEGGYSEAYWSRQGERWVIKASGVRGDGRHASATRVLTRVNKDLVHFTSVDRTTTGRTVPDVEEFALVRKPPAPR